jgi:hypothetical protein
LAWRAGEHSRCRYDLLTEQPDEFVARNHRSAYRIQAASGTPAWLHDKIAVVAYQLWQQEGCPYGRDKELWFKAVEQLKRPTKMP